MRKKSISLDFTPEMAVKLKALKKHKCEAKVLTTSARGRNKDMGDKCANFASIFLNGKPMCLRHAQSIALDILIRNKLADAL